MSLIRSLALVAVGGALGTVGTLATLILLAFRMQADTDNAYQAAATSGPSHVLHVEEYYLPIGLNAVGQTFVSEQYVFIATDGTIIPFGDPVTLENDACAPVAPDDASSYYGKPISL